MQHAEAEGCWQVQSMLVHAEGPGQLPLPVWKTGQILLAGTTGLSWVCRLQLQVWHLQEGLKLPQAGLLLL